MIYPIVAYGDSVLKKKAVEIEKGGDIDVKKLAEDMFETMYEANGVGLAAPQIGMGVRMFVVDAEPMDEETLKGFKKVFINAEKVEEDGEPWEYEEGCLSIPGIREKVERPEVIKLRYFDENWKEHEEEFDGLKARVIQHEYDHIDGVLFTDYLSGFKKRLIKGKLLNISKGKVDHDYRMKFPSVKNVRR
ncbi:peptide deformylase [Flammeovirgaceae bacterium SG7u.111]|nr:peptide deformylase [Flammeovirgaceae bacterium SG7u.132]WPO36712.1 peptide deformylase [Flammeovirgaceae bacterium SG7u.111]